jgi:hypothetical protein
VAQQFRSDRNFEFVFGSGNSAVVVRPPFRIQFGGESFGGSSSSTVPRGLNKIQIVLYGLAEKTRNALVKDSNESKYIPIQLKVGYGQNLELLFKGSVFRGITERRGTEIVSTIEALDGGFDASTSFTSKTVKGKNEAIREILKDMPNTTEGKITAQEELIRPKVLVGNSMKLLREQTGDQEIYIDKEQLFIMKKDEVVSLFVPLVSARTGLISTPQRENTIVTFETMLNPELRIGGLCQLESSVNKYLNGIYKINSLSYTGDNYGNDWKQQVNAFLSDRFTQVS